MFRNNKVALGAVAAACWLVACGGGGGDDPPAQSTQAPTPAAPSAQVNVAGLWAGSTSSNRAVVAISLSDGTIWALYSAIGNPNLIAGAVQANGSVSGNTISSSNALDFNLQTRSISSGSLTATMTPKQSTSGSMTINASTISFSGRYDAGFDAPPSLAAVAGSYTGPAAVASGAENASVSVTSNGSISGVSASGCRYSGTISPRTDGNVFNLSLTFAGGVCSNGTSTVTGIAIYDASSKRVYATALNSSRTNGLIFIGTKQ